MFKTHTGIVALAYLVANTEAIKSQFRPIKGTVPWHNTASAPTWHKPDWKINYEVPDFGVDTDIIASTTNLKKAEEDQKHELQASFDTPKGPPRDYFVPNFGQDSDIKTSLEHTGEAEASLGHVMQASFKPPKGPPMNYFVPNFGVDNEILSAHKNLKDTEGRLNHKYSVDSFDAAKGPPRDYFVPDFGIDQDIKDAQSNIAKQEAIHGKWTPVQDDNGVFLVPEAADNNSYTYNSALQLDSDIHLESDPICSSAGCTQYKHKKTKLGYDINYFVPNFGEDPEITASKQSLANTEDLFKHKWIFGTKESKAKWHNKAKDTDYDFAPKLDADIKTTQKNLDDAQDRLGHTWVIED